MHNTLIDTIKRCVAELNSKLYDLGDDALDIALDDQYVVYLKWLEAGFEFTTLSNDEVFRLHSELAHALARAQHALS